MVWSWANGATLERLGAPPIVEVICGVHFGALEIDPVLAGAFWADRRHDFPQRQIHPALQAAPTPVGMLGVGPVPLRTWLISADGSRLIQIQQDRFYLNWRRQPQHRPDDYPRFASSGPSGLLAQVLREFAAFSDFCDRTLGVTPQVHRVELGKVDHFAEGVAWQGLSDLGAMLPSLAPILKFAEGSRSDVLWRFHDRKDEAEFAASVASTLSFSPNSPQPLRGLKLETLTVLPAQNGDLDSRFRAANAILNAAFGMLVPAGERTKRFHREDAGV